MSNFFMLIFQKRTSPNSLLFQIKTSDRPSLHPSPGSSKLENSCSGSTFLFLSLVITSCPSAPVRCTPVASELIILLKVPPWFQIMPPRQINKKLFYPETLSLVIFGKIGGHQHGPTSLD